MRAAARVLLYALLCAIWGSTWLVIKVGYGGLGAFNVAGLRFLVAGAVMAPVALAMRARWPRGGREWALVVFLALFLFAGDYGLIYWAELSIESGLTAILFATMPLWTLFLAHAYVPGERLTLRTLSGTLLAFAGVAALFADHLRIDPAKLLPMLAVVGAAFCGALTSVATKRHGGDLHPAAVNAPAMLLGGALLLVVSILAGDGVGVPRDAGAWGAVLYLALAGSVVTFLIYFTLLKTWSTTTMSFISVFTPVVALALGFAVLGERPTAWTGVGAALILAGVALAVTRRR